MVEDTAHAANFLPWPTGASLLSIYENQSVAFLRCVREIRVISVWVVRSAFKEWKLSRQKTVKPVLRVDCSTTTHKLFLGGVCVCVCNERKPKVFGGGATKPGEEPSFLFVVWRCGWCAALLFAGSHVGCVCVCGSGVPDSSA